MEYNSINPFYMLMIEGIYGIILSFITFIVLFIFFPENFSIETYGQNYLLIILLLLFFFLLSGGRNSYKEITNKIFSPMTLSLSYCILNPLILIYYAITSNKAKDDDYLKILHFFINIFISLIIVFAGCVYNEVLILYCCSLEKDTFLEIRNRGMRDSVICDDMNDDDDFD